MSVPRQNKCMHIRREWFEISSACMNCLILQLNCGAQPLQNCITATQSAAAASGVWMCVLHSMQITSLVYVMTEMCNKIKWREALFILRYLSASPSSRKVEGVTTHQSALHVRRFCSSPPQWKSFRSMEVRGQYLAAIFTRNKES